jgi:heparosan-N-sulfate-glucuronate 5-epimerase
MPFLNRLHYYQRVLDAYLISGASQLSFWHDEPQINSAAPLHELGEYYMDFSRKAGYSGPHDSVGLPLLDYRGRLGLQYNPIAIAQWGLGNHTFFHHTGGPERREKFLAASDWLVAHLEQNPSGVWVWNHYFDWEYRTLLKAPWYSALAQGQGISCLVRASQETRSDEYLRAAERAFTSFLRPTSDGGVSFTDEQENLWFEEYIVSPPTHILNGFLWAAWGVYDYFLATRSAPAQRLFAAAVQTLKANLGRYDLGFWSLYEESDTVLPMLASPFYHRLQIVQLRVMHCLTGEEIFARFADRWETYARSPAKRGRALCYKSAFKLCYY